MEKQFLEWLGTYTLNPATLLAIIVVISTFILKGNDLYNSFKNKIDDKVERKVKKKLTDQQFTETISTLTETVNNLSSDLKEMKSMLNESRNEISDLKNKISTYEENNSNIVNQIDNINKNVDMLMDSDKESIRAFLLNEYHKWEHLGYIDVYSLAICEDKYKKYELEKGNTFVKDIMNELRQLEKRFNVLKDGRDPIQYIEIQPNNEMNYKSYYGDILNNISTHNSQK